MGADRADFTAWAGADCLDIQQTTQIDEKTADIGSYMENDPEIADYSLFVSKIFPVRLDNGEIENLKVELGNHTIFPLQYAQGRLPAEDDEIALSAIHKRREDCKGPIFHCCTQSRWIYRFRHPKSVCMAVTIHTGNGNIGRNHTGRYTGRKTVCCRTLMSEPEIVFGDEPTGALNTKTAKEMMELFTQINNDGIAILLVTHDPNIAARTERGLFLRDGEIVDECRISVFDFIF